VLPGLGLLRAVLIVLRGSLLAEVAEQAAGQQDLSLML
jgi:hypothetical protein